MPVIIDEVVISVEVTSQSPGGAGPASAASDDMHAIVTECVERVLEILQQKGER
jgi:hypothetical protein